MWVDLELGLLIAFGIVVFHAAFRQLTHAVPRNVLLQLSDHLQEGAILLTCPFGSREWKARICNAWATQLLGVDIRTDRDTMTDVLDRLGIPEPGTEEKQISGIHREREQTTGMPSRVISWTAIHSVWRPAWIGPRDHLYLIVVRDETEMERRDAMILRTQAYSREALCSELHNTVQQQMATLRICFEHMKDPTSPTFSDWLALAHEAAGQGVEDLVRIVREREVPTGGIQSLAERAQPLLKAAGTQLTIETSPEADTLISNASSLARGYLHQFLRETLQNTTHGNPPSGTPRQVTLRADVRDDMLVIEVQDNSGGIPPEPSRRNGLLLMELLIRQCEGELSFQDTEDGTLVSASIPVNNLVVSAV